jgi:hypothetical protein
MDNAKKTEIRQWYRKSQRDLESALTEAEEASPFDYTVLRILHTNSRICRKRYLPLLNI